MQWAREAGIEVIGELEFAARHTDGRIAAVTGTNGKTTTTGLLHHLLVTGGLDAGCAGNIGDSFAGAVADARQRPKATANLGREASSFQLEDTVDFRPDVASCSTSPPTTSTATATSTDTGTQMEHHVAPNGRRSPHRQR